MNNSQTPPSSPKRTEEKMPPSIKMDHYNAKAYKVLVNEGFDAAQKHMFTDQDDPSRQLSYAEMRMRYG